jgi:hypothetical protein
MSVLARDLDAYNRALTAYQRRAGGYNRSVDKYNASMVRDANGNILIQGMTGGSAGTDGSDAVPDSSYLMAVDTTGKVIAAKTVEGFNESAYGTSAIEGDTGFRMLRQNPIGTADNKPIYQEKPKEWTEEFKGKAPDPTYGQVKKAGAPSLAAQETGLIGEVIKGGGLKTGGGGFIRNRMASGDELAEEAAVVAGGGGKPGTKTSVMVR